MAIGAIIGMPVQHFVQPRACSKHTKHVAQTVSPAHSQTTKSAARAEVHKAQAPKRMCGRLMCRRVIGDRRQPAPGCCESCFSRLSRRCWRQWEKYEWK